MFAIKQDYFSEVSSRFTREDSSIIPEYYIAAGSSPLLSAEEEQELAYRVKKGDEEAVNILVNSNLRLVISIASKYACNGMSLMDLIQEGNIGLIGAARKFNPSEGCRFATYASLWIKQSILRSISDKGRTIRLPVYVEGILSLCKKEEDKFRINNGRDPEISDLAKIIFPVDSEKIRKKLSKKLKRIVSTDDPEFIDELRKEEDKASSKLREILLRSSDPLSFELESPDGGKKLLDSISSDEPNMTFEDYDELNHLLECLNSDERDIIIWRYGLNNTPACTLETISNRMGISKERVRQKENKAIEKMKAFSIKRQQSTSV